MTEGFECGILLEGFNDLREGDVFEVYETREIERTSLDEPPDGRRSSTPRRRAPGYVAILTVELHFPEAGVAEGEAQVRALGEGHSCGTASAPRSPRSTTTISGSAAR